MNVVLWFLQNQGGNSLWISVCQRSGITGAMILVCLEAVLCAQWIQFIAACLLMNLLELIAPIHDSVN